MTHNIEYGYLYMKRLCKIFGFFVFFSLYFPNFQQLTCVTFLFIKKL